VWWRMARSGRLRRPSASVAPCARFGRSLRLPWCPSRRGDWRKRRQWATISSRRSSRRDCSLPRKTDSNDPADWLWIAESDFAAIRVLAEREIGYPLCRSKLAEVLEKALKAELLRMGWPGVLSQFRFAA